MSYNSVSVYLFLILYLETVPPTSRRSGDCLCPRTNHSDSGQGHECTLQLYLCPPTTETIFFTILLSYLVGLVPPLFIEEELSFLQPVHFCICWCDSAVLTSYLFRQWLVCVCVPNWKNVLGASAVVRCVW